jgi:hypothetical protein
MSNQLKRFGLSRAEVLRGARNFRSLGRSAAEMTHAPGRGGAGTVIDPVDFALRHDDARTQVETVLAQAGVTAEDMPTAVEAVRRITDEHHPADVRPVAEFVAAVSATTCLRGRGLLIVPNLARYAQRIWA